jgi:hypothetical protein
MYEFELSKKIKNFKFLSIPCNYFYVYMFNLVYNIQIKRIITINNQNNFKICIIKLGSIETILL